jgi:ParB-like chromosome segregation protein Spo0J
MSTKAGFRAAGDAGEMEAEEAVDEENRWLLHGYDYVIETVAIDLLQPGDSPRMAGQDEDHTTLLMERLGKLPPILACARTMRVIDGMHRLEAARLRGAAAIEVVLVDVSEGDAFLLGVKANIAHGLPLSRADRTAAAARILSSHPDRSDRAIARIVGLAPGTVGTIRQRSTVQNGQSNARVGRDGRVRPATAAEGRRRAAEILAARPDLPLRRVAEEAGLSLGTVHNVRRRLHDGQNPVPEAAVTRRPGTARRSRGRGLKDVSWAAVRHQVIKDPAIRYASWGRELVRWLDANAATCGEWRGQVDNIPPYWIETVLDVALACRDEWQDFVAALDRRQREGV